MTNASIRNTIFALCFVLLSACLPGSEKKTAMIDVQTIIGTGPHAEQALAQIAEAQQIYQYNLNVIEKVLSTYKNKEQAQGYLAESRRQLQTQLNNSQVLVSQALQNTLTKVIDANTADYAMIVNVNGIIYIKKADADDNENMPENITPKMQALYNNTRVEYPPLPRRIDNPNLPADKGAK